MSYALVIFLSAFLLFLVQPLIAKQILPWFGGSAAVWGTCLLFFQTVLLAGYAYADAVNRWLSMHRQVLLHGVLLLFAAALMPIIADQSWRPLGTEEPIGRILGLLIATIGLPYFLLATTTPLIGAWYWRRHQSSVPYRLFALSNFASLLALIGFPFLVEPFFGNRETAWIWSGLFVLFALLCFALGRSTASYASGRVESVAAEPNNPAGTGSEAATVTPSNVLKVDWIRWILLSATGTVILLAVTSHLTQNISSAPLLWVIPLAIYLITFIISFDHPRWYVRAVYLPLAGLLLPTMAWLSQSLDLMLVTPIYACGLFVLCMVCHGELARLKPHPARLTAFYLSISVGGALGSLLMAVLAPIMLDGYFDLYLALVFASLVALLLPVGSNAGVQRKIRGLMLFVVGTVGTLSWVGISDYMSGVRFMERDFYGVVRTRDNPTGSDFRSLIHGSISHGGQLLDPKLQMTASSYFGPTSGYGRLFGSLPDRPRTVGVIGLGAGALAVYARPGDHWVFYEISPAVVRAAQKEFTFLDKMSGTHEIVLGDGRLSLDREKPRQFDVLAMDAFSGDSIPTHLITKEAMEIYMKHLKPDGVIILQATNRFVDLMPVARNLADAHGLSLVLVSDSPKFDDGPEYWLSMTDQVIMTRNKALLESSLIRSGSQDIPKNPNVPMFTDDYINLIRLLK
jgi:hypothetical protein